MTPHFRFGIIGAGSANSIVSTVHETNDWGTAAVHIALGKIQTINLTREKEHLTYFDQ